MRLHVIDVLVRDFLARPAGDTPYGSGHKKQKVIVNLGCGSDVLPWQCLTRYSDLCKDGKVKFVDVDFPDLIQRKRETVLKTRELREVLHWIREKGELADPIVFESDEYVQIGVDLRELGRLREGLDMVVDVEESEFLFVAEVSVTYMEREGADAVVKWAVGLGDGEFSFLLFCSFIAIGRVDGHGEDVC